MQDAPNRLQSQLERLNEVPAFARGWFRNVVMRRAVTHYTADRLAFVKVSRSEVEIAMQCESVHSQALPAAAINLLVETAASTLVGMNLRDDCRPMIKALTLEFLKPSSGNLRAVAQFTPAQQALMQASVTGEISIDVSVSDQTEVAPVVCAFVWTWAARQPNQAQSA